MPRLAIRIKSPSPVPFDEIMRRAMLVPPEKKAKKAIKKKENSISQKSTLK